MTTIAVQDIPVSLKCAGVVSGTIPAGLSSFFQNATHLLFGCWVKPIRKFDGVTFQDLMLFRGDSASSVFAGIFLMSTSDAIAVGGLGLTGGSYPVVLNSWIHAIAEIDIPGLRSRLFVNGVKVLDNAAVFTRDLVTVNSFVSYIGDNASPGFEGHLADVFIANRETAVTQAEIDAIYEKRMFPKNKHLFFWPIRKATIATIECENGIEQKPFPQNQFNAVISSSTMYSRDTPMTGRVVDRDAGNCLLFSGAAGYYRHNTDIPYNELSGRRYIGMSAWAMMSGNIIGGTRYIGQLTTSAGTAGLVIFINGTGTWQFGARSTDGEAASVTSAPAPGYMPNVNPREWYHMSLIIDFEAKIIAGYLNGVLIAYTNTATFAANVCQITRGAQEVVIGHGSNFWQGKLDDFMLFHLTGIPTDQEMRDWYLANKIPQQVKPVINIDCNDFGPDLIDKSGNSCNFQPVGVVVPYGLNHISYMG